MNNNMTNNTLMEVGNVGQDAPDVEAQRSAALRDVFMEQAVRDFYAQPQRVAEQKRREADIAVLNAVALYDEDPEARKMVDTHASYGCYSVPSMRDGANLYLYGRDYARAVAPGADGEPMGLCERMIEGVSDEERRKVYRQKFDALRASGSDTSRSYYGLFGEMVQEETRAGYRAQKQEAKQYEQQEARFHELLDMGFAGRAGEYTPEDVALLQLGGFSVSDMQVAGELYERAKLDAKLAHSHTEKNEHNLAKMAELIDRCPNGKRLEAELMLRVARDAEAERSDVEEGGFVGKAVEAVGDFLSPIGCALSDVQDMMEPISREEKIRRDVEFRATLSGESPDELLGYYHKGKTLSGGMSEARAQGVAAARERYGLTGYSIASGIAELGAFLVQFSNPATGLAWFGGSLEDKQRRYDYGDPQGSALGHAGRALAYTAAEYSGFKYAPRLAWSGAGKLFGATVGRLKGGAVGNAVGRGMAWLNRSAAGAAAMGAARGVGDVGVIIPGATGALHSLYDVMPGTDERLDSGLEELSGLWQQLRKSEYWAESAISGGVFGVMNVPAWKKAQRMAKEKQGEQFLDYGGDPEFLEKSKKAALAQDLPEILNRELERERREEKGEMIHRAIARGKNQFNKSQERQERGDNAVLAMMQLRGYEVVPEGGQFRLFYGGKVEDGKAVRGEKSVLLSEEDLNVFISLQMDSMGKLGAHVMREAMAKQRLADAMQGVDVDVEWMLGAMNGRKVEEAAAKAVERVESRTKELVEQEKVGEAEARKRAQEEVHEDVLDNVTAGWLKNDEGKMPTLGQIISYGEQWRHRREQAEASGMAVTGSRANVRTFHKADGSVRRVLRVALGASPKEIAEELGEQAALRFMESGSGGERINPVQAFRLLDSLREWMAGHEDKEIAGVADTFLTMHKDKEQEQLYKRITGEDFDVYDIDALTPEQEAYIRAEVVEGMSRLMFSDLMRDVMTKNPELPGWARELGGDLTLDMAEAAQQFMLARAFMEARAQGWLTDAVQKVMGVGRDEALRLVAQGAEAVRKALRGNAEPEPGEYLDALYRQQKTQAELDALLGSEVAVAPEVFDAFEQEAREGQKRLDEEREAQEEARAEKAQEDVAEMQADNPEMSREEAVKATNERKNRNRQEQIETAANAEYDSDFEGGVCQSVEDPQGGAMCKMGFIAIGKLKVLPNFKIGANAETGVVEPLKGDYRADHDPIRVWRRVDGSLMVISGRHRLDAAKHAGMDKISAFVYEQSEVHDEQWARRYDIESNIRDNQATALEVALYVRGEWNGGRALSDEEIARAGIARKGKAGAIGCEIARKGSQAVVDAWRNGALTEQQAFWIASFMPGNERAQRAGVGMALSGDVTKGEILTAMEAAAAIGKMGDSLGVGQEVDLFGNALDNDAFLNFVAKYITRKRNEIGKDLAYIGATATKRNAAEMAKKYGVDVKSPEAMKRKQEELQRLKQRWNNPYTDSELMGEIREAYRKETLEGWAEGEEAKDAVGEEEASAGLPGEAEGQGVLFSREPASLRIWDARLHDLREGQDVVAGESVESDMSAYGEVETLDKVQERWNRTLDDYYSGKLNGWRRPLLFGQTPAVLQMLGAPALRMTITRDVLNKVTRDKHSLDIDELRKLPDSMHEPLAVFRSGTQLDSMVVLTEMQEQGKPVVAAIHLDSTQGHLRVNKIASVYGKNNSLGLFSGDILYADKTKIGKWSTTRGLQLPKVVQSISRRHRILNPGDVVKWKNENNLPQVHFSVKSEGRDYVTDKDGNPVPIADLVERVHRENRDRLAELGKDPRYAEVMGKIRDAISGEITKAFDYRDLNEAEVEFFRDRLGFDLSGYAWQLTPDNLKTVLKAGKRGKYSFALTEDELGLIPAMIDDIATSGTATVQSNVKAITPGGTVFVKVYNPLTRMEMDFRLAPRLNKQKMYNKADEKKKPRLTLTSARAFLSQSAGLAPTRPPKSVPSFGGNLTTPAGTVKQNLLKQEFSSQNTSINKVKTPAVFEMVKKAIGWIKDTTNIDIGGGKYDTLTRSLAEVGVTSHIYEPYGRTSNENAYILSQLQSGTMRGDTATCSNVLNVIKESDVRANVIHQVAKAIKPEGTAFFTIYEGDGKGGGKVSKNDCWQNNRKAESYVEEVQQHFGDVSMKGKLIVAKQPLEQDSPAQWRRGGDSDDVVHFSIFGMTARGAACADERGETYVDPADGKRKWVVSDAESRLRDNFTFGQLNVAAGGHKDTTLGAVLHFPVLFENYPDLEKVRVRFYKPQESDGLGGYFNPYPEDGSAAYIAVNIGACRTPGKVLETLRHESQHWIQSAEGHAMGGGFSTEQEACRYLEHAIEQRKQSVADDAWSRDNLAFLESLLVRVKGGDRVAVTDTYMYSRGEQEARYTGSGYGKDGEEPMLGGVSGEAPSHYTVAVTTGATELGGVTFGGMGRFAYLLERRLLPSMEFTHDRQVMQMKETVQRMMKQLRMLPDGGADGLKLAADGLNVMERLTSLLPGSYRMALEPYRLYLTFYSILHGTGDAESASGVIPMKGWDQRMRGAMNKMVWHLLEDGEVLASDLPYWTAHPEKMREIANLAEEARADWKVAKEEAEKDVDDDGSSQGERAKKIDARAMDIFAEMQPEFFEEVLRAIGEVRADKLMDKFLQRVALQLDHFRKDRTLGKIRRVVDSVNVMPGKDGKPRKGMMHADDYRKLQDMVALLEMTKSERDGVLDLYDGEHEGFKKWEEVDAAELVEVEVYDADGKKRRISVSRQEFDVYASYEQMSAAQAEAMSRALGEFITTGRQAWQNSEEAAKARIARMCAPLLEGFSETEEERRGRELERMRSFGKHMLSFIFNDAQFFDVMSADAACKDWAGEFARRIADGHCDMEMWEKERAGFTWDAICRAAGTRDRKKAVLWLDAVKSTRDTGVTLVPQEPEYAAEAEATVRRQLLSLMHRKTRLKNFSPNKFAETVRWLASRADAVLPKSIREELVQKYGRIGDADKSVLKGEAAAASLFSEAEFGKFKDVGKTIRERAAKTRDRWREKHEERMKEISAGGARLKISQAEAAYRVLLCEQADYKEMMAWQGYDEAAVAKLREFAGESVMKLAYELREKLNERTPQMKVLYEKLYGTPFPEVENYFRAYFDAGNESRENKLLGGEGVGNAAGGGKVKVLYTRTKHNAKVDSTMDVINAFESAMKEQDTLFAWGQLGQDIKRVLNHRQNGLSMRKALEEKYGHSWVKEMDRWGDMFSSITAQHEEFAQSAGKFIRAVGSAGALTILNGRVGSLMKQFTGIFNSLCGSELVGIWEWKAAMGRFISGLGKISMKEMAKRPELAGRFKGWSEAMNKEAALQMPDVKAGHGATAPWTRVGMSFMEYLDVRANVVSCCVLYDAVYCKLRKADKSLTHEQLDEAAMGEVRMSLALKSQPNDFRSRSMMATKHSVMSAGSLFLGGESINTFANICRLAARKEWKKVAAVWLTHGAALQVLTFLFNWLTDDKEQWENRHWWHYAEQSLLGPLMGIPFVSTAVSQGVGALSTYLPSKYRPWLPTQSLLPMGDFTRSFGEFNKAFFGKKPSSWQDKVIATETALRSLLLVCCVVYRDPQNPKDAAIKGGLYGASLIGNVLDFLLRTERAAEERL